ncbi:MAG: FAD-binding oxidoreductase [Proteobacteria bacterium]|nr:FAD-binding oxidoreductase [Pseudomonadota bacterium]
MGLKKEAFKSIASIVGIENISDEPAVMDSYTWQYTGELTPGAQEKFMKHRPAAVVLPGNTSEVQRIARVCNQYKLKFKAFSTGWGSWGSQHSEGVIQLDLRRMNRIREINEKDMYAVVEPYVIWAELQAEILKKGMNCSIIGAGSNTSPLASCTAMEGFGSYGHSMGYNNRNVLGVEWILPNGELLEIGSLGSGAGWITGDGPGPSLRGILRGYFGAAGSFGVVTGAAVRLYNWGGPPEIECDGIDPEEQRLVEWPENCEVYGVHFETDEQFETFMFKLGETEIGYASLFYGHGVMANGIARLDVDSMNELDELYGMLPEKLLYILLVGSSQEELTYQKRVMDKLLETYNGKKFDPIDDPKEKDQSFLMLAKVGQVAAAGTFGKGCSFVPAACGIFLHQRHWTSAVNMSGKIKTEFIKDGALVDDRGQGHWGMLQDHGHTLYVENETMFDPFDKKSVEGVIDYFEAVDKTLIEEKIGFPVIAEHSVCGYRDTDIHEKAGNHLGGYHHWLTKVRKAFNPNDTMD